MEEKLQSLLERIREEGVEKARQEADTIIQQAENEARKKIEEAEQKAEQHWKQAKKEAEEYRRNVEAELKLSAQQSVDALKQELTELVTTKAIEDPLKAPFQQTDFLRDLILRLVEKWTPEQGVQLHLSADQYPELYQFFTQQVQQQLHDGLTVKPVSNLRDGFRLGPEDGSYVISFSTEDFTAFFADFLRPHTKKLLFDN